MSSSIPTKSRAMVRNREQGHCARCGGSGSQWHHRRSRSVRDAHQHCPCNGLLLCATCHAWVHANPFESRANGWIVSRHSLPFEQQLSHRLYGWIRAACDGRWTFAHSYSEEERYEK